MEAPEPYQRMEQERQELLKSPRNRSPHKSPAASSDISREDKAAADRAAVARAEVFEKASIRTATAYVLYVSRHIQRLVAERVTGRRKSGGRRLSELQLQRKPKHRLLLRQSLPQSSRSAIIPAASLVLFFNDED